MRIILNGSIDLYEDGIDFEDLEIEIVNECECDIEDYLMDCDECGFCDEEEDDYDEEEDCEEYIDDMIDDYVDLIVELGTHPDYVEQTLTQLVEEILYLVEDE